VDWNNFGLVLLNRQAREEREELISPLRFWR
jgi:hypothetical protein